jgi:hypothetical protein
VVRKLVCEICLTDIGRFDDAAISQPMRPGMFLPLAEGYAQPFPTEVEWEYFLCPVCGKRAMGWDAEMEGLTREDRLLTDTGFFVVPKVPVVADGVADAPVVTAVAAAVQAPAPRRKYKPREKKSGDRGKKRGGGK